MRVSTSSFISALAAAGLLLGSAAAVQAQVDPEAGDTGEWPPPAAEPAAEPAPAPEPYTPEPAAAPAEDMDVGSGGGTDHSKVVGNLGVGFFGVGTIPYPDPPLNAPTIGVRYWMSEQMAIEGALGLGFSSVSDDGRSAFGLLLHGAVPYNLFAADHFAFHVIPELDLGFGSGSAPGGDPEYSSVFFRLGARAAAEIQFGFIDIPHLAIQAGVGLHLQYASQSRSMMGMDVDSSEFSFGTGVFSNPFQIFTGNISAIYYFDMGM